MNAKSLMVAAGVSLAALSGLAIVIDVEPGTSLESIQARIRAERSGNPALAYENFVVRLAAGRWELSRPLVMGAEDSNVEWRAAPGAEVRISGGRIVSVPADKVSDEEILSRLPERARGKVVQFDLGKMGVEDFGDYLYNHEDAITRRVASTWNQGEFMKGSHPPPKGDKSAGRLELFCDDAPMTVARMPLEKSLHVGTLLGPLTRTGPGKGKIVSPEARFTVKEPIPPAWFKEPDPHVCGCWCTDWAEQHQKIVAFDAATNAITLSKPWHQYLYKSGTYFYGFNMLCELDEPGEWMLDRPAKRLIAWLPDGWRRLEVSMAPRLVEARGATNVVLKGLVLEACRNSAVWFKDCEGCRVESCTIRNVGQHAVMVEDGRRCSVERSNLHGMGGGGVWLVDANRKTLVKSGHYVENCEIHHFGRWNRMYRAGVCMAGVGMRASHNFIHDAPHSAILYFGNDLVMEYNDIWRVCRESKDCGAFYTGRSWLLRGNKIFHNRFREIIGLGGNHCRTLYLDDSMAEVEIAGNFFEKCTWGIFVGGSRENVITNNIFVDCPQAFYADARGRGWQRPHIQSRLAEIEKHGTLNGVKFLEDPFVSRYPALRNLMGSDYYSPVSNVVERNIFWRGKGEWCEKYGPDERIRKSADWWCTLTYGKPGFAEQNSFTNNLVNVDPRFVDPEHGDFRLREDSPAFKIGFAPIPMEKIGIEK